METLSTRKPYLFIMLMILISNIGPALACDICSSGGGAGMQGVMPGFDRNMLGINYQFNRFSHPKTALNMNGNSQVIADHFHQQQLQWRHYEGARWQTQISVPFAVNRRIEEDRQYGLSGLGDPEFRGGYLLLNTGADSLKKRVKQLFLIGGHIRFPLGKYQQRNSDKLMYPNNFQAGSGAWSVGPNAFYSLRMNAWGLSAQSQYSLNLKNELSYSRGNLWSNSLFLFYWKEMKRSTLLPSISINHDNMQSDISYGTPEYNTGGRRLMAGAGIDVFKSDWNLSLYAQRSLFQDLGPSQPKHDFRLSFGLTRFI